MKLLQKGICFLLLCSALKAFDVSASIERGVKWLLKQPHPNGSFGTIPGRNDKGHVGMTALAVLALCESLPYLQEQKTKKKAVSCLKKAVQYLLKCQRKSGCIATPGSSLTSYETAVALSALVRYQRLKKFPGLAQAIQKAKIYLLQQQYTEQRGVYPSQAIYGGWSESEEKEPSEVSLAVTHLVLEALHQAKVSPQNPM